jgi:hypothetical protein
LRFRTNRLQCIFILSVIQRYKWVILLAVLVMLNVIRYWPVKHATQTAANGFPPGAGGFQQPGPGGQQAMEAALQARIDALPDDQKAAAQQRVQQDREFFGSLKDLSPADRMPKMMQYFAQNPPPPWMLPPRPPGGGQQGGPGGQGGNGFNGFQGNGGVPPILPPDARRPFEQAIINGMKAAGGQ